MIMTEKILERIAYWIKVCEIEINKAEAELDIEDIEFYKGQLVAYENTKKIVQEVAKEYGNGWIPCSERLPEHCGYSVLLTVENAFGQRDVCKAFTNYMEEGKLLFYTNEKEFCSELTSSKLSDAWKPIAWKTLDAPYQKGGQ